MHKTTAQSLVRPVQMTIPTDGVAFAESIHGERFRMDEREDAFAKIVFVVRGRVVFERSGSAELTCGEGAFFAVEAGWRHRIHDLSPSTLLLLGMSPGYLGKDAGRRALWEGVLQASGTSVRIQTSMPNPRFERLWRLALLEQHGNAIGREVQIRSCADQILVYLGRLRRGLPAGGAGDRVTNVLREMESSFFDAWSLDRACGMAGLSRHYFTKLFRQQTGTSFLDKLTTLRLDHAVRLLQRDGHSIAGVAFACGFEDLSHFYRVFSSRLGMPPGEWRTNHPRGKLHTKRGKGVS